MFKVFKVFKVFSFPKFTFPQLFLSEASLACQGPPQANFGGHFNLSEACVSPGCDNVWWASKEDPTFQRPFHLRPMSALVVTTFDEPKLAKL